MQRKPLLKTYDVIFHGDFLSLNQFGLKGAGRLFINEEEGIVEMDADESHSTFEKIPGKVIEKLPLFGWVLQLILDYELAGNTTISFPQSGIKDVARFESIISFLAPAKFGSTALKRIRFSALSPAVAQEIEEVLKLTPSVSKPALKAHPYRRSESVDKIMILKMMAAGILIPVILILCLFILYFAWTKGGYYGIAVLLAALFIFALWRVFRNKSKDITSIQVNSKK